MDRPPVAALLALVALGCGSSSGGVIETATYPGEPTPPVGGPPQVSGPPSPPPPVCPSRRTVRGAPVATGCLLDGSPPDAASDAADEGADATGGLDATDATDAAPADAADAAASDASADACTPGGCVLACVPGFHDVSTVVNGCVVWLCCVPDDAGAGGDGG